MVVFEAWVDTESWLRNNYIDVEFEIVHKILTITIKNFQPKKKQTKIVNNKRIGLK